MSTKIKTAALLLCLSTVLLTSGCGDTAEDVPASSAPAESFYFGTEQSTWTPAPSPSPSPAPTPVPDSSPEPESAEEPASVSLPEEDETNALDKRIETFLSQMTLEEKVAQLFVITPEALTGAGQVTAAGPTTQAAIDDCPVGGLIYMAGNLISREQCQAMLTNTQAYSMERIGLPMFLSVDEEGGTVARISGTGKFDVPDIGDMRDLGDTGDVDAAYSTGESIGSYLSDLGFNVDFAPVADVLTNPANTVVRVRSFGTEPQLVSDMALAVGKGLEDQGVLPVYKHFPGHGATAGDTHNGYASTDKTLAQLWESELIPFQACVDGGAKVIMVGHISLPNVTGDGTPATLSSVLITDLLRGEMGYDGIVITDAMNMGAIVDQYTSSEAAIGAIQAGADLILMPNDFSTAYQGVLAAVRDGTISESRIDESLTRILRVKLPMVPAD